MIVFMPVGIDNLVLSIGDELVWIWLWAKGTWLIMALTYKLPTIH